MLEVSEHDKAVMEQSFAVMQEIVRKVPLGLDLSPTEQLVWDAGCGAINTITQIYLSGQ